MSYLKNKIPPPLITVLFGLIIWLCSSLFSPLNLPDNIRLLSTYIIIVLGLLFSLAGIISFKIAKTTVNPIRPESASSLVKSGIFRFSRNPMYVGMALFLIAWSIYLASLPSLLLIPLFILYMNYFQIQPEEHALLGLFGDEYISYKKQVRRWL
jgi:protein-S-isoprenylcysteine O-methyltransferase Ste14